MRTRFREFLNDLYRDFRDRRLLLPAGLLVAALIAVPVLLSESPVSPPPAPQAQQIEATAATPAVLAEGVGVRNYRKRLNQLKQKNPFRQRFTAPLAADVLELDVGDSGGGGDVSAGGDVDGDGGDGGPPPSGSGPPSTQDRADPAERPEPAEERWFAWEVDLVFGPVGDTERYEGVRPMELLPSRRNAVAAMASIGMRGNRAGFIFIEDVVRSRGEGRCAPGPRRCTFLLLREGEQRRVTLAIPRADGTREEITYRLRVLDIVQTEVAPGELRSQDGDE